MALFTCLFISTFASSAETLQKQILTLTTPEDEGVFTQYLRDIFNILGDRTHIKFIIHELPKKRAIHAANNGQFDGMAARISGMALRGFPNVQMIGASHFTVKHILFSSKPSLKTHIFDQQSLIENGNNLHLRVGFLRGSKKAESILSGLIAKNRVPFDSPQDAFDRIELGHLDLFLGGPGIVSKALLKEKYSHSKIKEIVILSETRLFPYLHIKHADLIPKIERELTKMAREGTLAKLRATFE
ncbi:MAG: transporter substrate-binding domain-containing protein [Pseudomonas marincola]